MIRCLKPRLTPMSIGRVKPASVERLQGGTWRRIRHRYLSANPLCAHCYKSGRIAEARELDHIVPLWKGGSESEANYQGLCVACHALKTAAEATERSGIAG